MVWVIFLSHWASFLVCLVVFFPFNVGVLGWHTYNTLQVGILGKLVSSSSGDRNVWELGAKTCGCPVQEGTGLQCHCGGLAVAGPAALSSVCRVHQTGGKRCGQVHQLDGGKTGGRSLMRPKLASLLVLNKMVVLIPFHLNINIFWGNSNLQNKHRHFLARKQHGDKNDKTVKSRHSPALPHPLIFS